MVEPWITILVAIVYVTILFAVASYGDRIFGQSSVQSRSRPNIYALSLAVYCTTWTFFGSVGLASTSGLNFLAIYVGPILAITIGFPVFKRVVKLAKEERITSVADFLGSRYGKNLKVAAVAAIIAVVGTIPYIALQLKAISSSVDTLLVEFNNGFPFGRQQAGDVSLLIAGALALFAILFGTRHADATEHQHGLMLAIALESVVKLVAFLCAGIFITWFMFDGVSDLANQALSNSQILTMVDNGFDIGTFLILTFLSLSVFMLLPRQFHVAVVENNSLKELERARWLFPVYLVAINLFVIPIAVAGILQFGVAANADDYVLLLPILENQTVLALLVFLGGLSAGMAMVVVACVALAIMISNDLIVPAILRFRAQLGREDPINMETNILNIRRAAIFSVLVLAYLYYRVADNSAALASIGLVSFAAVAQLAPAFFGGLIWKNGNARGAMLGMIVGFCVWTYCLLLPTLLPDGTSFVAQGPFELSLLKPQNLFGFDLTPLANGVIWSLLLNSLAYVSGSLSRKSDPLERMQASIFAGFQSPYNRSSGIGSLRINTEELKDTLARYVGKTRTERSFDEYLKKRRAPVPADGTIDDDLLRFSEQLLASSIGASSSRLVHSLLLKRYDEAGSSNFELLDEASKALQFNRDVLQTAMDQLDHGISVFDKDYRLASWNRQFRTMLNLPTHLGQAGIPLAKIIREAVRINQIREDGYVGDDLLKQLVEAQSVWQLTLAKTETVLEIQTSAMPEGGIVIVWHDITEKVLAAKALAEANETLEKRVEERTHELEIAKQLADQANASKTRFLAAAGHDILQPLNAARLYSATMIERSRGEKNGDLADKISLSLSSVEEILASILTISRLDTADHEANIQAFPLKAITEQLEIEFAPIAQQEGLTLTFVHSSAWVNSDRALLRRLLQNLISNALKFTPSGKVLIGCRHRWNGISLEVFDTGIGMTKDQQRLIFREFTRLDNMVDQVPGLGLGLSIVDRIADLLGIKIDVSSQPNEGTRFQLLLEQANAQAMPRSRTTEYRSGRGKLNGMYVLCIDNEQSILDGMAALLEQWGCEVDAALNLQSALEKAKTRGLTPDLVLIDYHLDNSTGIDVMNRLRKNINEHLRGVLITADRTDDVKKMAESLDLTVIHKPVRPAALRAIVTQHSPKSKIAAE